MVASVIQGVKIGDLHSSIQQCIVYHKLDKHWEIGITNVKPKTFHRQMAFLKSQAYIGESITKVFTANNASPKAIGISFDDGYQSVFANAFPIMQQYNFRATIFVIADYIGKWNDWEAQLGWRKFLHLSTDELKQLINSGWELGSHSNSHRSLTALTDLQAKNELQSSKLKLEDLFGVPVNCFAFPFGRYNIKHLFMAVEIGYQKVCINSLRDKIPPELNEFVVVRRPIYLFDTISTFQKKCFQPKLGFILTKQISIANKLAYGTILVQNYRKIVFHN